MKEFILKSIIRGIQMGILSVLLCNSTLEGIARTYFSTRNITTDPTFELSISNYYFYLQHLYSNNPYAFTCFITPLYQRSTDRSHPGRYFLPENKSCVTVEEDGTGDIGSLWLELISPDDTSFSACLSLKPRRIVYGAYFQTYVDLSRFWCHSWLSVGFAAIRARHSIGVCETNSTRNGTLVVDGYPIRTVRAALDNPQWQYGRFSRYPLERGGIDDIQIKLGHDWIYNECLNHASLYVVGVIPTGRRLTGQYIFEPQVGSKNGAIGLGFNGDYTVWRTDYRKLLLMTDLKYLYTFGTHEIRSFDLCPNGDWSRFLQFVFEQEAANSLPGINYTTQKVEVKRRSSINWWTALHYEHCNCHVELGYVLWYRQAEKICGRCPLVDDLGIYDLATACEIQTSANDANISQSFVPPNQPTSDGFDFVSLTADRLNRKSATHPTVLSNKLYLALAYDTVCGCVPVVASIGGAYEFGSGKYKCAVLDQGAIWFKLGTSF